MVRRPLVCVFGLVIAFAAGCDMKALLPKPPVETPRAPQESASAPTNNALVAANRAARRMEIASDLRSLAMLQMTQTMMNGQAPENWEAMIAANPGQDAFFKKLQDAGVVVLWDAPELAKQAGGGDVIYAYPKDAIQYGGPVATVNANVTQISADELKAKLTAMGKTWEEPAVVAPGDPAAGETPASVDSETPAPATP